MWGEDGPYSQVQLIVETRILDDSISRIMLVVEADINPFTFKFVHRRRARFKDDVLINQLLDYAEDRGRDGYVVAAGEPIEASGKGAFELAQKRAKYTEAAILKMHSFVMRELGLKT